MPKRAITTTGPEITLDEQAAAPLYRQLYERLRDAILDGQLAPGARLPSTRGLASELGISRTTTALAYEYLLLEGYITSKVGAGSRVALLRTSPGEQHLDDPLVPPVPPLSRRGRRVVSTPSTETFYNSPSSQAANLFRVGQPDVASFPFETWARLLARHARHSLPDASFYQGVRGYAPLRAAIAAHIGLTRGVHCTPEQIIITAGAQGALDLVARTLLDRGDTVWIEDPGYGGARGALVSAGATLIRVPVDREGIDVAAGRRRRPEARLAIVTPSHQFPTGVTMSLDRRLALLRWAKDTHAWIVEDDYDSEYRFAGRPLEALQGLDGDGRVIYIGTFSKVLFPSLRLGFLVAPSTPREGLLAARQFIDVHPPLLEQMALADFISEGHFARHLRKMRLRYRERRDTLVDTLTSELGDVLEVTAPDAGMHLTAWLTEDLDSAVITQAAARRGLQILPVSRFSVEALPRDGLVLGFAGNTSQELRAGVRTLAQAVRESARPVQRALQRSL